MNWVGLLRYIWTCFEGSFQLEELLICEVVLGTLCFCHCWFTPSTCAQKGPLLAQKVFRASSIDSLEQHSGHFNNLPCRFLSFPLFTAQQKVFCFVPFFYIFQQRKQHATLPSAHSLAETTFADFYMCTSLRETILTKNRGGGEKNQIILLRTFLPLG